MEFFVRMFCHTMGVRGDGRPWLWLCPGSFLRSLKQEFSIIYIDVIGPGKSLEKVVNSVWNVRNILYQFKKRNKTE